MQAIEIARDILQQQGRRPGLAGRMALIQKFSMAFGIARGLIQTGTPDELRVRLSETLALEQQAGRSTIAVTSTNAAAQQINHAVYSRLVDAGVIDPATVTYGRDGDPIAAHVRTGYLNFEALTHVINAWIGYTSDGQLILKAITGDGGTRKENWYRMKARPGGGPGG